MENEHKYTVDLNWKDSRLGELSSPELEESIEVVTPPDFPEGIEGKWSPEHLFVASVSSCLMTTFLAIADYSKLHYTSLDIQAIGKVEKLDGKFKVSEIELKPVLTIPEEKDLPKAERILEKADKACLISNSITSAIVFEPRVEVRELADT